MRFPVLLVAATLVLGVPSGAQGQVARPLFDTLPHGIVRVRNTGPSLWRDSTSWKLVRERSFGASVLAEPTAIAIDRTGGIVVADLKGDGILHFGPDGQQMRVIGKKGSGPGEYHGPVAMGVHGDTIAICDTGQDRVEMWRSTGSLLTEWRASWCGSIGAMLFDDRSRILIPSLARQGSGAIPVWIRRRVDGSGGDTLRPPAEDAPAQTTRGKRGEATAIAIQMPAPFQPRRIGTIMANGTYVHGWSGSYSLVMAPRWTDTSRLIELPGARMPVSRQVVDSFMAHLSARSTISRADIPATHGYFTDLHADEAGRIWVERPAADGTAGWFDVVDAEGRFLGTVRSPGGRFYRAVWANGRVYRLAENSDGEPIVEVFRIDRTTR